LIVGGIMVRDERGRAVLLYLPPLLVAVLCIASTTNDWGLASSSLALLERLGTGIVDLSFRVADAPGTQAALLSAGLTIAAAGAAFLGRRPGGVRLLLCLGLLALAAMVTIRGGHAHRIPVAGAALVAALAVGSILYGTRMRFVAPKERVASTIPAWDVWASVLFCGSAVLLFTGIERETGSVFYSNWQSWERLSAPSSLGDLLRITTGTARNSMDSGPYCLLVRTAFHLFGASWTTLRGISAASVLVAAFALHRHLAARSSPGVALLGVALFTTSPFVIDSAHVPNFLGPSLLLSVLTIIAFVRWIERGGIGNGILLGALLFADLYGYSPLRFFLAFFPVAAVILLLLQRDSPWRDRLLTVAVAALCVAVPTALALALGRSEVTDLAFADGEFIAYHVVAQGLGGLESSPLRDLVAHAGQIMDATFCVGPEGGTFHEGLVAPLTIVHSVAILLGLFSLPYRVVRLRPVAWLLALMLLCQIVAMALMLPPLVRRMTVYVPLLVCLGVGGLDQVSRLGARSQTDGRRSSSALAASVAAAVMLFAVAVAHYPRIVRPPSAGELAASPCFHMRPITDQVLERGYELLLVDTPLDETTPGACEDKILWGNWAFHRWRNGSRWRKGDRVGRLGIASDAGGASCMSHGDMLFGVGDRSAAVAVDAPLLSDVDIRAPVFAIGTGLQLVYVDPRRLAGRAWLEQWSAAGHLHHCR